MNSKLILIRTKGKEGAGEHGAESCPYSLPLEEAFFSA